MTGQLIEEGYSQEMSNGQNLRKVCGIISLIFICHFEKGLFGNKPNYHDPLQLHLF